MTKGLMVAICLPFVLGLPFVLATYAFFWYETANGPHRSRLVELSGARPGRWILCGVLSGVFATAIVIVTYPLGLLHRPKSREEETGARPPVLLVHGLYHNAGAWFLYRWWLRRAGYDRVETFQYSSWGRSFEALQAEFSATVERLSSCAGKPVILVGHSLGGLLCRACAGEASLQGKVAALVTLGSPHQGSKLAALAIGSLGRSLLYRGDLIRGLERVTLPASLPRLAVVSAVDSMVLPNEALHVRGEQWETHETPPISHVSLLYHPGTARRVLAFLDRLP